jgi:hypothetical protein
MKDIVVDALKIEVLSEVGQGFYGLHLKHLLKHFLSSEEKDLLITVTELEWPREDAEEFRLRETHREPFFNHEII